MNHFLMLLLHGRVYDVERTRRTTNKLVSSFNHKNMKLTYSFSVSFHVFMKQGLLLQGG